MSEFQREAFFKKYIEELREKEAKQQALLAKKNRRNNQADYSDLFSFSNNFNAQKILKNSILKP